MPLTKQAPGQKQRRRKIAKAVPMMGAAGLSLALASAGAPAMAGREQGPPEPHIPAGHQITLHEEEISDVSLATFYVFEKENALPLRPRTRFAMGACGACGGCGCGGCAGGCWTGTDYTSSVFGGDSNLPPQTKPARKHPRTVKPAQTSKSPQ